MSSICLYLGDHLQPGVMDIKEQEVRDDQGGKRSGCGAKQLGSDTDHRELEASAFCHVLDDCIKSEDVAECVHPRICMHKVQQLHAIKCALHINVFPGKAKTSGAVLKLQGM